MRSMKRWSVLTMMLGLALLPACIGNSLDDGDGADVVLEVVALQTTAVTGDVQTGTCAAGGTPCLSSFDCAQNDTCDIDLSDQECRVTDWSMQLRSVPLNASATTSPYNDILVSSIQVDYSDATFAVLWTRVIPVTCTVAPSATQSCRFTPINFADLTLDNTTLNMLAIVRGRTVSGEAVSANFGAQLNIEDCIP